VSGGRPFLGAGEEGPVRVALVGVPYDRTQSYRHGAAEGPRAVREASWSLETYSPGLGLDLCEVGLGDLGDLEVRELEPEAMVAEVERAVASLQPDAVPVLLGGDHTVTVGAVRALRRHPNLRALVFDAHLDLRDEYEGDRWSHACAVRRAWEVLGDGCVALLGARSGTREEWAFAREHCRWVHSALTVPETVLEELRAYPVYVSLDLDVLDPSSAPGVGNPEPGGPGFDDLVQALGLLRGLRTVGLDLVETSPPWDPSGLTPVVAAKLLREAILTFCGLPQAR
jgi:agmatinase